MAGQQAAGRAGIDAGRLAALFSPERDGCAPARPRAPGVRPPGRPPARRRPRTWMQKRAGGFPRYPGQARSAWLAGPDAAAAHTEAFAAAAAGLAA